MRRYLSYKDSGVEWIGEIPSHWNTIKTYLITENLDGKRVPLNSEERSDIQGEIPYWGSGGIVDYINKYIFDEELLLVGEDGSPFFDSYRDVSFYVNEKIWVNNHIHILRSKKDIVDTKFLVNSFNTVDYKEYISGSTRDKLTQSDLNRIIHPIPPLSEQKQIVSYLDKKTEGIDKLIQTKVRKIELLKEYRTSLINEVVTKGLNPNVEMKDSGVEWIGEIPSHWNVLRNKYFTQSQKNKSQTGEEELLSVSEYHGVIPRKNIREGEEHLTRSESLEGYLKVRKGELVSNIMLMWKRGLGVSEYEGIVSPSYSVFSFHNSEPKYFHYLYRTDQYVSEFRRNSTGVIESRLRLYDDSFGSLFSHFPPLSEQEQIVSYLDEQTQLIDKNIQTEERKIELLKEFRQSLISEVVTGKIKVCNDEEVH